MSRASKLRKELGIAAAFLWDRLLAVAAILIVAGLAVVLVSLDMARTGYRPNNGIVFYLFELSLFVICVWLMIEYIRQRAFYKQIYRALEHENRLEAPLLVQSPVTAEQKRMKRLLEAQHTAYLDELGRYRRRQEMHNHFVLQWVHQMKTPVSIIDLLAQEGKLLPEQAAREERDRLFSSMQEETERLGSGLEMMLYTARLDKFELDLHIQRTALHEIVRRSVNTHKRLCIRHSIFPSVHGEAYAETDEKWISFVVNQLVSNAIKYSKRKPDSKKLRLLLEQFGEGSARLTVQDEGIGIEPYDLPRVFDSFFTGANGRATGESTGMGLYLAKQVCSRLGHGLTLSSVPGEGTTATITFRSDGIHRLGGR